MKNFNVYLKRDLGKKSQKEYICMLVDLGYRETFITFDTTLISELTGISFAQMHTLEIGKKELVGQFVPGGAK